MSLTSATVARIAHLSRIRLEPESQERMLKDLQQILSWVEQLQTVDTDNVEPMTSVAPHRLRWRDDVVDDGGIQTTVLQNGPETQSGFYVVPKVVD